MGKGLQSIGDLANSLSGELVDVNTNVDPLLTTICNQISNAHASPLDTNYYLDLFNCTQEAEKTTATLAAINPIYHSLGNGLDEVSVNLPYLRGSDLEVLYSSIFNSEPASG